MVITTQCVLSDGVGPLDRDACPEFHLQQCIGMGRLGGGYSNSNRHAMTSVKNQLGPELHLQQCIGMGRLRGGGAIPTDVLRPA
jgi:hypothetical protein